MHEESIWSESKTILIISKTNGLKAKDKARKGLPIIKRDRFIPFIKDQYKVQSVRKENKKESGPEYNRRWCRNRKDSGSQISFRHN